MYLSFFEFFLNKLFLLLIFGSICLVLVAFSLIIFLNKPSFNFFKLFLVILPIFLINEASAGENFISADTSENQVIPFNQLIEHIFNEDYKSYNELAKSYNIGSYLGKNASSLNSQYPLLNSYNLIHQVFLASNIDSSNLIVSTDSYTKYEVAYLSKNQLSRNEVLELLHKFRAPIIYLDKDNIWVLAPTDSSTNWEPRPLTANNQFVLNNFSKNLAIFPKASSNLQTMRLGDSTIFNKLTLQVDSSTEFKTSHKSLDFSKLDFVFEDKFKNSPLVNHQLFDFNKRVIHHRSEVNSSVQSYDLNNFHVSDIILTERFKSGRNIATQRLIQSNLQFNTVSSALNKLLKR